MLHNYISLSCIHQTDVVSDVTYCAGLYIHICVQIITDVGFGYSGDLVYKSQAEVADVYNYVLGYRSAKAAVIVPEWLGKYPYTQIHRYIVSC